MIKSESIVIIEDNVALGDTIADFLEGKNFIAVNFISAEDALLYLSNNIPDLIICDIMLPGITGLQLAKRLKTNQKTKLIPIIFLSAVNYKITSREAFNIGAEDYITKPFNFIELHESIVTRLDKARAIKTKINYLKKERDDYEKKIAALEKLINHDIRASAAKILQNKRLIQSEIQHEELKTLLLNQTSKILDATGSTSSQNQIPKKNNNPNISSEYRVFVVDDDVFYLRILEKYLNQTFKNVHVEIYSKPEEALAKLKISLPSLILLDINMPKINGFEFLDEMQKRGINDIPVIIHSSTSSPKEISSITNKKNVKGFVGKPLKQELLKISITNILGHEI